MQRKINMLKGFNSIASGDVVLVEESIGAVAGCPDVFVG